MSLEFLHRGFAGEADFSGLLVNADALHGDAVAHLDDILGAADTEVGQLGDVAEAFFTREAFDEGAEVLHAGDATGVDFPIFNGDAAAVATTAATTKVVDLLDRAVHGFAVVGVDEDLAGVVVGDVDLRARRLGDAADGLATGPDEQADLFGIDLNRLNAGSVGAEILAGSGKRAEHGLKDFNAGLAGLMDGGLGDLEGETVDLQVELEAGDALGGAGDLEVHVAEMVFLTDDVGDGRPLGDCTVGVLGHEADGNAGNGSDDGHAGVHEGQAAAADRGHRGRAVGSHDLGDDADGVGEHVLGREHGNEGAFGKRAVADFAATGAAEAAGLTNRERRKVVVKDEALGLHAAGEGVEALGFLGRPEGRDDEALGIAALEEGGTVDAGEDVDLGADLAERLGIAAVGADAAGEDGLAVGLVLEVFEDDVEVNVAEATGAELGGEGGVGFGLEAFDVGGADGLLVAEDSGGDAVGGDDALDDGAGLGAGADEGEVGLGLAAESDEFLDATDDRLDGLMGEGEGFDEAVFGNLVGGTLDHEHVLLVAHVDEIEGAAEHLLDGRIGYELAVDLGDADGGDRAVPRNLGDGEGGAGTVDHRDVGFVDLVGGEELTDDLDFIQEPLREERAARTVAEAGGEDFLFGRTALALEVAAGETAGGGVFLAVIDGEREEVLAGLHRLGDGGSDEDVGLTDSDVDRAGGEGGDGAGGEGDPKFWDRDGIFLIHYLFFRFACRG